VRKKQNIFFFFFFFFVIIIKREKNKNKCFCSAPASQRSLWRHRIPEPESRAQSLSRLPQRARQGRATTTKSKGKKKNDFFFFFFSSLERKSGLAGVSACAGREETMRSAEKKRKTKGSNFLPWFF
jgi:hypothetical protein